MSQQLCVIRLERKAVRLSTQFFYLMLKILSKITCTKITYRHEQKWGEWGKFCGKSYSISLYLSCYEEVQMIFEVYEDLEDE